MKKILLFFILLGFAKNSWADTGIFESYVILNSGSTTYYDAQATTANPDFQNANLGTFTAGSTFFLQGGEIKTWKNNGGDVTGGFMYYRIYLVYDTAPSFTEINLPWVEDLDFPSNPGHGISQRTDSARFLMSVLQWRSQTPVNCHQPQGNDLRPPASDPGCLNCT